jgi:uncharacterized Tic20 family protein
MPDPNDNLTPPPPPATPPPPSSPPPSSPPPAADGTPGAEERQWAMFAHLSAIVGYLLTVAVGGGWGCFIGPLVIWLVKKDTMPFVADQAKEALNFNITLAIVFVILTVFSIITLGVGLLIAIPLMLIIGIAALVLIVIAAIRANEGRAYRYPATIRLVN